MEDSKVEKMQCITPGASETCSAMHTARLVIPTADNMLESCQDGQMLPRVTLKQIRDVQAKVEKALSSDNVTHYMLGQDETDSESQGVHILAKLRDAEGALADCSSLVHAMAAQF